MDGQIKKNTAEKRMSSSYITAKSEERIGAVRARYLEMIAELKNNDYVYITDQSGALVGIVSAKEIFAAKETDPISGIMKKDVARVRAGTKQERVATLALLHDFDAIPVVDKENKLIGVVPSGEILNILHEENVEDFLKMAGIHKTNGRPILDAEKVGPLKFAELRVPWLIVGLFGGILAASVIEFFHDSLTELFVLASFIPLVVYIAGAIASQSMTIFIRSSA